MPSFYPRMMPAPRLPLTPPEFLPSYGSGSHCGDFQFEQPLPRGRTAVRQREEGSRDYTDCYGQNDMLSAPPSLGYALSGSYTHSSTALPPVNAFYEPIAAPLLPPMRTQAPIGNEVGMIHHAVNEPTARPEQPAKDEKPVGGVSAKLDYEMDVMTDFVSEMTQGIIPIGRPVPPSFRKWVHQVLQATRLPSATIILSLSYLSIRVTRLSADGQFKPSEGQIYRFLTIALLLGSKFLDDNTFINRSWSEVSGISVADLNMMEVEWLVSIRFELHRDPKEHQGFSSWFEHWQNYQQQLRSRSIRQDRLTPIDTSVQRQRAPLQESSIASCPPSYAKAFQEYVPKPQIHYDTPYPQYDSWQSQQPASDYSPPSAPYTGPTTPEYFGGHSVWTVPEGYSRRTMFGFPPLSQSQSQQLGPSTSAQYHPASLVPPSYTPPYTGNSWGNHGIHCSCFYCSRNNATMGFGHSYHPQAVFA